MRSGAPFWGRKIFLFFFWGMTAVVLPPLGRWGRMKNENIEKTGKISKLETLSDTQKSWIIELATNARLVDVVMALKEEGIETSPASLSRFIRKDREKRLLEEGTEMKEAVSALAE